jgi:hypothetical protein
MEFDINLEVLNAYTPELGAAYAKALDHIKPTVAHVIAGGRSSRWTLSSIRSGWSMGKFIDLLCKAMGTPYSDAYSNQVKGASIGLDQRDFRERSPE